MKLNHTQHMSSELILLLNKKNNFKLNYVQYQKKLNMKFSYKLFVICGLKQTKILKCQQSFIIEKHN